MAIHAALLRGINVGGKNKIKMAELKAAFEALGLGRVQTYIQSGNVLFESDRTETELRERIERQIADTFGISLTAVLRTAEELETIVGRCPFPAEEVAAAEAASQAECLYVAMLPEAPAPSGVAKLAGANNGVDVYRIVGRDVYLLFRDSVRNAKLAANLPKLGVPATVRNWNTMGKLAEMAAAMRSGT
jgi:uncharacterized protein (DUF1697 family)